MNRSKENNRKSSIFRKLLHYLIVTFLLLAVLSVVIICLTSAGAFARRIADEMVPRVHAITRLASRYQTGQMSYDSFLDVAVREQRGAEVYIIDQNGILQISSVALDRQSVVTFDHELAAHANEILNGGETYVWSSDWHGSNGIVVGAPIYDNMRRISGVVLMTKPANHVVASMSGLMMIIVASCLIASSIMIIPAYFWSKRLSKPVQQMTEISIQMANGDFSARADESGTDEIGQLGSALNHLSQRLCTNINDLTLTRNRLHMILEDMSEGVAAFDSNAQIVYANRAALLLLDAQDERAFLNKLPAVKHICIEAIESGRPQELTMDYGERKLLITLSRSQEISDIAAGVIAVVLDVTERERLEQTRRDYVANVSHELRTPIASIRSLAETLNDGLVKTDDDRNRYYGYILRESMRLSRLINDLLELSRLQSGAIALIKQPFDMAPLMREVCERMGETAGYSGIRVKLSLNEDEELPVLSNRDRLEQTLVALMDNAIKFASDDGVIDVSVKDAGERYMVNVRNTGHIAESDLPHLFERFYKADTAHTDRSGTGLGLAIVSEVMGLLGESIQAKNDGDYAVFCFTILKQR